ncbi:MAG: excinuclease ABC subunit UvrC [Aridibacter sp.]
MTKILLSQLETLPEKEGVYCVYNRQKRVLFAGIAESVKNEVEKILKEKKSFWKEVEIAQIEFLETANTDLIKLFAQTIRRKNPLYNISLNDQKLYPHLKLTREKYSRLLVTRKIENDKAEYFGAFLPETKVRFLLDFLNRTFRLRSCTIDIDGNFPLPCTQFYEKYCVAPCVDNLCDERAYIEFVGLVRLFLSNNTENLERFLFKQIDSASEILDFETARKWRDILLNVQIMNSEKDLQVRLDDAVDSYEIEEKNKHVFIRLVTQRGRKILGNRVFLFENPQNFTPEIILPQFLWQYYQYHSPKEIRLRQDFPSRKFLAKVLTRRENRLINIIIIKENSKKITTERAFGRTEFEFNFKQIKPTANSRTIQYELKKEFGLKILPERIECYDAAHISGTNFVAAKVVWEKGKFLTGENKYWLLDEKSELKTLEKGVEKNFEIDGKLPDLILIDGGKSQLNIVLNVLSKFHERKFAVIAAVKPPHRHNQISHFINETGKIFEMKSQSDAMQTLVKLRDSAHELANRIHRTQRDTAHFYELAGLLPILNEKERNELIRKFGSIKRLKDGAQEDFIDLLGDKNGRKVFFLLKMKEKNQPVEIKPLIVQIGFDAENGKAEDLQPLKLMNKELKTGKRTGGGDRN